MLGENMIMAFHAIMANKMRSFLTMLGIIIGIGSVISIVSIGDTMRGLFADLYKDAAEIGYWVRRWYPSDTMWRMCGTAITLPWMNLIRSRKSSGMRYPISTVTPA